MKTHMERQAEGDPLPAPGRPRQSGAKLRLLLGLAVAATFLGLTFFRLEWHTVQTAIVAARSGPLLLGLASLTAGFSIRILRWWWMLRVLEPGLPLRNCARPFLISLAINNTVPLRAGDVLRTVGFRHELRSPPMRILGTLVIERLLDLFTLLAFFFAGLLSVAAGAFPPSLFRASLAMAACCLLSLMTFILWPDRLRQGLAWLSSRPWVSPRWSVRLDAWVEQLFETLSLLRLPKLALQLLGLSILTWAFEGGLFACVAWSLQASAHPMGPWFALSTGTLATLIPGSPGHLGTFDYFAMLGLIAYGAKRTMAAVFALLVHVFLWGPVTLIGGFLFATSRHVTGDSPSHSGVNRPNDLPKF